MACAFALFPYFVYMRSNSFSDLNPRCSPIGLVPNRVCRPQGRIPDFRKGGFISIKVWGFALLILYIFMKYPVKMK